VLARHGERPRETFTAGVTDRRGVKARVGRTLLESTLAWCDGIARACGVSQPLEGPRGPLVPCGREAAGSVSEPDYTLFHRIAEPASARIRLRIVELGLKPRIDFQNAETDGRAELARLGGSATPALWDGRVLTAGEAAIAQQLTAMRPDREDGRSAGP
jgi:hypothetical protein